MAGSGSGNSKNGNSVQTVVTSVVYNGAIFLVFILLFLIFRPKNPRVYEKRIASNTVKDRFKPRALAKGWIAWLKDLVTRPDSEIIRDTGLDGYFFLRFLRFMFYVSVLGIVMLMPILLPVNATNGHGLTGLDQLAFGNVKDKNRYFAHALLSWLFFGSVLFFIYREMLFYTAARQAVLTSEAYKSRLSSRSVLINSIPEQYLNEEYLRSTFAGVKYVTIARDAKELRKTVKKRDKLADKLEGAENKLISKAVKKRVKLEKKGKSPNTDEITDYAKVPTHRLKPLIGKKVETIPYASEEIPRMNQEISTLQADYPQNKKLSAAFITFYNQAQAETAAQMLSFHRPLQFAPRFVGVNPEEIVWDNLALTWYQRLVKSLLASSFCTALIIFWAIPVAFVGFISQIDALIRLFPWLSFLHKLPSVLYGLISSLLPTILLAVLMMLLPIMIRKAARIAGAPTETLVEYYTQQVYFGFNVVHVFLVVSLSSSILSSLKDILDNPSSVMTLLARQLPAASNFFMNWILLQALTISSGALLQIVALILFHALGKILDNTPRKRWSRANIIGKTGWGTVFPIYTNMAVITFSYSIISPLVLVFSAALFLFSYIASLNNLTFVVGQTNGRGIFFARALKQLFIGLYLAQVVLLILFVFAKAWGPVVLELVIVLFTVWFQVHLSRAFAPLIFVLPRSLLDNASSAEYRDNASSNATAPVPSNRYVGDAEKLGVSGVNAHGNSQGRPSQAETAAFVDPEAATASPPQGGLMQRIFKPWLYYTPELLRQRLLSSGVWHDAPTPLEEGDEATAFRDPSANSTNPVVWFPADPYGWADQEMRKLRHAEVNAYTSGAWWQVDQEKHKAEMEYTNNIKEIPVYTDAPEY